MMALRITRIALAAIVMASGAASARAQAFLPAQGDGTVSLLYQDQLFKYHFVPTTPFDAGPIYSRSMVMDVTYGVTDKVAVSIALPWVNTRYSGSRPHPLDPLNPSAGSN